MNPEEERIKRTEYYAKRVEAQFAETVNELVALNKSIPKLPNGEMYSFDSLSPEKRTEAEALLRRLHVATTLTIKQGMKTEWGVANAEVDKLMASLFGKRNVEELELFKASRDHNDTAMKTFIERAEGGMNLSDRVWKSVIQLRAEMEVALTVGIGTGQSASILSLAKGVRECLNDPDLMFKRFRYKDEKGNWKTKWKKRERDHETGRVRFVDYDKDSYKTGPGVYKSSAKNAMRLTRTETNMAYRQADHERWQKMDFVKGVKVELSRKHPKPDICNDLKGDYPKDFNFIGWHPQCFCHATPILQTPEEMERMIDEYKAGNGENFKFKGENITEPPANFKRYVKEYAGEKTPYFIQKNGSLVEAILHPQVTPKPELITMQRAESEYQYDKELSFNLKSDIISTIC